MDKEQVRLWIELIAALTIPFVLLGSLYRSIHQNKGIGARTIQFAAVGVIVPFLLITCLEQALDKNVVGTIVGGLTGYILGGISNYDSSGRTGSGSSARD